MAINAVLCIGALTLTLSRAQAGPRSTPSQCQADAKTCGLLYSAFKPLLRPMLPSVSRVTLTTVGLWLAHSRVYDVAASPRSMAFDLALTPLHLPSQPLGSTSVSPARLSAPWGRKEALCSCFYFQPRAWHTVGARGGLIVDQGS